MRQVMSKASKDSEDRNVLEFELGVRVYPPKRDGGYWRVRWEERRQPKDTSAKDQTAAIKKAQDIVERLRRSVPTELGRAKGEHLVAHYLDPRRRPPRVTQWSVKHREEQTRICEKYVLPVIAEVSCRELTRADFQDIINLASTASVAHHIRRTLTALMGAGLEEGYVMTGRDLLRGVRWHGETTVTNEPVDRAVTEDEIPTVAAVHELAAAAAALTGVWWRELQILVVAYSGMRWGEHVALTWEQVDSDRRRIRLDRQVVEARNSLIPTLPKGRRRRITMFPVTTPGGVALAELMQRRLDELGPGDVVFPAARGGWMRRSNYGRQIWDPAADAVGWPKGGRSWQWTFHSLRHVFATWALHEARIPIEDLSRLMGHSSTRVTQDIYVHVRDDMFDRFFEATG
jgi:integrase